MSRSLYFSASDTAVSADVRIAEYTEHSGNMTVRPVLDVSLPDTAVLPLVYGERGVYWNLVAAGSRAGRYHYRLIINYIPPPGQRYAAAFSVTIGGTAVELLKRLPAPA